MRKAMAMPGGPSTCAPRANLSGRLGKEVLQGFVLFLAACLAASSSPSLLVTGPPETGDERPSIAPPLDGSRVLHLEEEAARVEAERLREEADELAGRLEVSRAAEKDLLGELSLLDREFAVAAGRARAAELELKAAGLAAARAQEAAASLDERLGATRRRIGLVLQALSREGERPEWRRLVEGGDEGANELAVSAALRHAELGRELEAARDAARNAAEEAQRRLAAVDRAREAQALSLDELARRRAARESRLGSLRRESVRLDAELARARSDWQELLGGAAASPAPGPAPGPAPRGSASAGIEPDLELASDDWTDLATRRGLLPWPLAEAERGALIERFGQVRDPRSGTRTRRNGVVFAAPAGAPIRAVAPGRVVFRDWYKGFGLALVIDHGAGFLSVVAHCLELFPKLGEQVAEGQVVGLVGESGSLDGPRLYFQLQRGGEALDPEDWLRR